MVVTRYRCDICGEEFDSEIDINGSCTLCYPETGDHTYNCDEKYDQICSKCAHNIGKVIKTIKDNNMKEAMDIEKLTEKEWDEISEKLDRLLEE